LPEFQGLIFDFNGVLLWDNELHETAWRRYSAHLRGTPLSDQEMREHVHGRVNADIFAYLLGKPVASADLPILAEAKESIYRELCLAAGDIFRLSPGAVELLDAMQNAGIPFAIATSSAEPNVRFYIDHLHLDRWFEPERLIYDRGLYPGKPAPYIYLEAAERLGMLPAECVVVEDSSAGIQAATAAGVGWLVALGPPGRHPELRTLPGVDEVIVDLHAFQLSLFSMSGSAKPDGGRSFDRQHVSRKTGDESIAQIAQRVRTTFAERVDHWKARSLIERHWILRDFKKRTGLPADRWLENLRRIETLATASDLEALAVEQPPISVLGDYYRHMVVMAKTFTRDEELLAAQLESIESWIEDVDRLSILIHPAERDAI